MCLSCMEEQHSHNTDGSESSKKDRYQHYTKSRKMETENER